MSNPYEVPKADLMHGHVDGVESRKRPGWVWAISVFYAFSLISTPFTLYMVYAGTLPMSPEQKSYYSSLGITGWFMSFASLAIMAVAVISFFLMKKTSIKAWLALNIVSVLGLIYNAAATNWLAAVGMAGLVSSVIGVAITMSIYFYAKRLDARLLLK